MTPMQARCSNSKFPMMPHMGPRPMCIIHYDFYLFFAVWYKDIVENAKKKACRDLMGYIDKRKRKHVCLSIAQKDKFLCLLEKLHSSVSVKRPTEEHVVGMTIIYDLKNRRTHC